MSIGRLGPSKDHFVIDWDATMMDKEAFPGMVSRALLGYPHSQVTLGVDHSDRRTGNLNAPRFRGIIRVS